MPKIGTFALLYHASSKGSKAELDVLVLYNLGQVNYVVAPVHVVHHLLKQSSVQLFKLNERPQRERVALYFVASDGVVAENKYSGIKCRI